MRFEQGGDDMEIAAIFADYNWIPFLFIIAGIIFVIIEMFHPGFGAPGIIGMILLVAGILLYAKTVIQALIMIAVILAILGVALALVLQSASKGRLAKHIVLDSTINDDIKFSAFDDLSYLVGGEGKTLSVLRPSGVADFNGVRLDVVSEGEFIQKGATVYIEKIEGNKIVVKQKPASDN
jgi:membrane-bound ClpP family serine protease